MTHTQKLSAKFNRLTSALRKAESIKGADKLVNRLDQKLTTVWMQINLSN